MKLRRNGLVPYTPIGSRKPLHGSVEMRKITSFLIFIGHLTCGYSQDAKVKLNRADTISFYSYERFRSYPFMLGSVKTNDKDSYDIPFEGGVYGLENDKIQACVMPEGRNNSVLFKTESQLKKDTLEILISGFNGVEGQILLIRIFGNRYMVLYQMESTVDGVDGNPEKKIIKPTKTLLRLKNLRFQKKGSSVRGYTEFEGKCISGCEKRSFNIKIKGNFSAHINRR